MLVCCLLFATVALWAREGFVQTRDGRIYEGHIRFESNAVVVVNAEKELRIQIPLTNLNEVAFSLQTRDGGEKIRSTVTGELPAGWQSEDIGSVRHPGSARFVAGQFQVSGGGTNILADSDSFHFVFRTAQDSAEIVTRITQVQFTHSWARGGLMMRESLAADSRHVLLAVTPARGGMVQWRDRLAEGTRTEFDGGMRIPCWLKLKRDGNIFTASKSADGRQWGVVEKVEMKAARDFYVGLAVVGLNEQALNRSVFERVEQGASLRNRWFIPQVELQSGSTQVGHIEKMDNTAVYFEPIAGKTPLSRLNIANLRFQIIPARLGFWLNVGRPGVLLATGEFIDGECRGIEGEKITISSVPLGLCRFDSSSEVIALVLRKRDPVANYSYELKTVDGSVWRGIQVNLDLGGVLIREPSLGLRRIALHEVLELRRRS
jgi:hypothetical protein